MPSWDDFESFWEVFGVPWGILGGILGGLGDLLGGLGGLLGDLGGLLGHLESQVVQLLRFKFNKAQVGGWNFSVCVHVRTNFTKSSTK